MVRLHSHSYSLGLTNKSKNPVLITVHPQLVGIFLNASIFFLLLEMVVSPQYHFKDRRVFHLPSTAVGNQGCITNDLYSKSTLSKFPGKEFCLAVHRYNLGTNNLCNAVI